jgi:hypothetical protein
MEGVIYKINLIIITEICRRGMGGGSKSIERNVLVRGRPPSTSIFRLWSKSILFTGTGCTNKFVHSPMPLIMYLHVYFAKRLR